MSTLPPRSADAADGPGRRTGRRRSDPIERIPVRGEPASPGRTVRPRRQDVSAGPSRSGASAPQAAVPPDPDPLGKMALFSGDEPRRPLGTFVVECSSCRRETPISGPGLVRAALPFSLHLPLVRHFSSYMRCPACGRRTWLRVSWRP